MVVVLLWIAVALPLAFEQRTLYLRDVFASHLHLKAFGAASLERGEIPAFNPQWALGQPFRGNPNALPFYPGNLLYLVLPFWSAFNLHYMLHWLLALVAMWKLAKELGQGPEAALFAGITYAGSGWVLTALSFYNILTVSAWWPLVLLGGHRGGVRGVGLGGAAAGLALLGGEPITALLGVVPLLAVAIWSRGWRRGTAETVLIGGLGLLVALPQVVASLRVLPFTVRAVASAGGGGLFALHPWRLLELLLPLPFGWPTLGGGAAVPVLVGPVYVFTLYCGVVALALAAAAVRRHRGWAGLAAASLALAWLGGPLAPWLDRLGGGLVRYPEKFLFLLALALPLLAGWGLEAVAAGHRRWTRFAWAGAAALLLVGLLFGTAASRLPESSAGGLSPDHLLSAAGQSLFAALLLAAAAWGVRRSLARLVVVLQLFALVQLAPLVSTIDAEPLRHPAAWAERLKPGATVAAATLQSPFLDPVPRFAVPPPRLASLVGVGHDLLEPPTGVLHGLSYPLAPDLEGMYSPLSKLVQRSLPRLDATGRVRWLGALGAEYLVAAIGDPPPGLRPLDRREVFGVPVRLLEVERTAPAVWWPWEVAVAPNPEAAFQAVAATPDPIRRVVVPRPLEHRPGGEVRLLEASADRLVLEVTGDGGVAVVRRAYQPLLEAESDGEPLETLPVNVALTGVVVPPGRHRVVLDVSSVPIVLAGLVAAAALLLALGLAMKKIK